MYFPQIVFTGGRKFSQFRSDVLIVKTKKEPGVETPGWTNTCHEKNS
jgi:hypothetical protein